MRPKGAHKNGLPPRRHAREHAIAPDQAVEKRCPEMREEGREEQVGEVSVEVAEPRIERQIMRQDRWQPRRSWCWARALLVFISSAHAERFRFLALTRHWQFANVRFAP